MAHSMLLTGGSRLWSSYCNQLTKRPILTKIATGLVGTIIGDGIAQYSTNREQRRKLGESFSYDWARAGRMCGYSAVLGTPLAHLWFQFLDTSIFPGRTGPLATLTKLFLDQGLMAPLGIILFFYTLSRLENNSHDVAAATTKEKFKPTVLANYCLWPLANYINFALVPPQQRILYINVIYVFWVTFLSHMASKKGDDGNKELIKEVRHRAA